MKITPEVVRKMIASSKTTEERALLTMAWRYGLTFKVVSILKVDAVRLKSRPPSIRLPHGVFPLSRDASKALTRHLKEQGLPPTNKLFTRGKSNRSLQRILSRAGERVGIPGLSFEALRNARGQQLARELLPQDLAFYLGISIRAAAVYYERVPPCIEQIERAALR